MCTLPPTPPDVHERGRLDRLVAALASRAVTQESRQPPVRLPPKVEARLLRAVAAAAPRPPTVRAELARRGIILVEAKRLPDDLLAGRLWRLIHELAQLRVYLLHTDHLNDRELYETLCEELEDPEFVLDPDDRAMTVVDILGGWSAQDHDTYLRYYADEVYRRNHSLDFPQEPLPAAESPPWDRDRRLPCLWRLPEREASEVPA